MNRNTLFKISFILSIFLVVGCSSSKVKFESAENYSIMKPTRPERKELYVGTRNVFTLVPENTKIEYEYSIVNGTIEKSKNHKNDISIFSRNFDPTYLYVKYKNKVDTITFYKRNIPQPSLRYQTSKIDTLLLKQYRTLEVFPLL